MKRLIIGLISLAVMMLVAGNAQADVKQKTVPVKLQVLQIIELDVTEPATIIPEPEDYAFEFSKKKQTVIACSTAPKDEYGFADRHDAIFVKMFTNARKGATLYFAGRSNPDHNKTLQIQDVYLTVQKEKTYVLSNVMDCGTYGIDGAYADAMTNPVTSAASWVQCHQEAKRLCGVTEKTESTRLWVLKLGIGSLAEYEENMDGYEMNLTFILMPNVV